MQNKTFMLIKHMIKRTLGIFLLAATFVGCTPTFDWRTVRSDDLLYEVLYPGKPSRAEKILMFQDQRIKMTMEAVKIKDGLYAVGVIQVPAELKSQESLNSLKSFIQDGMLSNLKTEQPVQGQAITMRTSAATSLAAKEWVIDGVGPDQQRRLLRLRVVERKFPDGQTFIFQQSILQSLSAEQSLEKVLLSDEHMMFLNGFKPY